MLFNFSSQSLHFQVSICNRVTQVADASLPKTTEISLNTVLLVFSTVKLLIDKWWKNHRNRRREDKRESNKHEIFLVCAADSVSHSDRFFFSAHPRATGIYTCSVICSPVHFSVPIWHRNVEAGICYFARSKNLRN